MYVLENVLKVNILFFFVGIIKVELKFIINGESLYGEFFCFFFNLVLLFNF